MHILFVSSEVMPFAKTGGLGDVSGILPQTLARTGEKSSVILPLYKAVRKNGFKPELVKSGIRFLMGSAENTFNHYHLKNETVDVYFVEKDEYFDRSYLYGTPQGDYPDNATRFGFFSKTVLHSIPYIGKIDILHLNDWQSALIPFYLRLYLKEDKGLKGIKTIFTIHNLAYQGLFEKEVMKPLGLPERFYNMNGLEFYGRVSFMKAGILYSDAISTVSKAYAREVLTPEYGCGLDGLLNTRRKDLYGILNGADYSVWNPEHDTFIYKNYSSSDLSGKLDCKIALLKELGMDSDPKKPLCGMVTRLAHQKGVDIVAEAMKDMLNQGILFVLLGTGDERYERLFKEIKGLFKKDVSINITFNEALAHKIEAGADMFLIPSRYEPCGLNQMYSLKYATVPVVRAVGGLDDTIEDFDPSAKKGNGFKFKDATPTAFLGALKRAVTAYKDKSLWPALLRNCLKNDFSWEASAREYIMLYRKLLSS